MGEFIAGPSFSGRSAALMERLKVLAPAFFVGPYAEGALSGLSSTVADEIAIYRAPARVHTEFAPLYFAAFATRKPPTLSGGEQVLLALHCFSLSDYGVIGIDTALEQLDPANRDCALAYLSGGDFKALLIDNRFDGVAGWSTQECSGETAFACDLAAATRDLKPRAAPLMIRVLRRECEDAVALAPWSVARAVKCDRTRGRRQHTGEQLEQRGLARAVRPDEAVGLRRLERDTGVAENVASPRIIE